jgi:hypothetical protein
MTSQEWIMVKTPFPDQPNLSTTKREFLRSGGHRNFFFSSIRGSDLLIRQTVAGGLERQFTLFDAASGKDVSKPFPTNPEWWLFNRSRTACLTVEGGQPVILDTLSAQSGQPKVLARPRWPLSDHTLYNGHSAALTDDAQFLVLFPYITSSSYVVASNFTCEVWSTNGTSEKWQLPIERKEGKFVDAELVDGKILLLWRGLLSNGAEDGVELLDKQGKSLHSGKISAFTHGPLWRLERQEILFPYYEGSGWDGEVSRTYYLWNYSSNTVQQIILKR